MQGIKRLAALAAICGLSLAGCEDPDDLPPARAAAAQAVPSPTAEEHSAPGREYIAAQGISFVVPAGWSSTRNIPPAFVCYAMPPENGFTTNMSVNATPDGGASIDRAPAEIKKALAGALNGWRFIEDGFVDIHGRRAYRICSEITMNQMPLRLLQYLIIGNNKKVYTITFTTSAGRYDQNKGTFDQWANSILVD